MAGVIHKFCRKSFVGKKYKKLRTSIEKSTAMFDKEKAEEWFSKLSGGVAVLKIGGASEAEVGERKDRARDALNATRAAVEVGIMPGVYTRACVSFVQLPVHSHHPRTAEDASIQAPSTIAAGSEPGLLLYDSSTVISYASSPQSSSTDY